MMKKLILLLVLCAQAAFGSGIHPQYEIDFVSGSKSHRYDFTPDAKGIAIINFKDNVGKTHKRKMSKSEVTALTSEIANLVWQSKYRQPASSPNRACHPYAKVRAPGDDLTICTEDKVTVARAEGLLIRLHATFTK